MAAGPGRCRLPSAIKGPCHSASFLDETTGWLANSDIFGTTTDGGASWNLRSLPETANKIATIDTYLPGEGYLLDQNGVLFFTKDDGQHWREVSHLELGPLKMSMSAYQLAAMRFSDSKHGLIVVSPGDYDNGGQMMAFHTYNGGENWIFESVPVAAGSVYLSRTGGYLTVITAYDQLALLRYEE
jgi:Photosynthesis system II assembly factor YCF48